MTKTLQLILGILTYFICYIIALSGMKIDLSLYAIIPLPLNATNKALLFLALHRQRDTALTGQRCVTLYTLALCNTKMRQ